MITTYEHARYIVTRNVLTFMCSTMVMLALVNLLMDGENLLPSLYAAFISGSLLGFLIKYKSISITALIAIILAYGLNSYNLTRASNFENYVDLFWLINLSLFAYFTLGKTIGHIYLTINILTLFLISVFTKIGYITLYPASNVYDFSSYLDLSLNLLICTVFFGYLLSQFLKQTDKAKYDSIQSNFELQKQFDEKSIMLKEIHHRVKNNLQVITSLLRLQLYKLNDSENTQAFEESINRISSMALIHEQMYQGDKVKDIKLDVYIRDLTKNLRDSYANAQSVELKIISDVDSISLNSIVPLSLILNELISNSLKHAFKNENEGIISIQFIKQKNKSITLIYSDNGIWKAPKSEDSFGLELIETFTEQLEGKFTLDTSNGTKYTFQFNDIDIKY